jgi:RTX calcium-binding nonapeptide repeat (4 copies)
MRRVAPFLLALLVLPAPAHAATVSVTTAFIQTAKGDGYYVNQAEFVADARERNDVTVRQEGAAVIVRDEAAVVRAGAGCVGLDDHTARCVPGRTSRFQAVWVWLGDDDDRFADAGVVDRSTADGGPGADVLEGGRGTLDGGDGPDRLVAGPTGTSLAGGPGVDELVGGSGPDLLEGDPASGPFAADVMDGGGGVDTASYFGRTVAVRVDLMIAAAHGAIGENDTIRGVESVGGGDGRDVLGGDDGTNVLSAGGEGGGDVLLGRGGGDTLHGSAESDVLSGGGGNDELLGYDGADILDGGAGDDRLGGRESRRDAADDVRCAGGADLVVEADVEDVVRDDCERVFAWPFFISPPRREGRGYVVDVEDGSSRPPCAVRVIVVRGRRSARASRWLRDPDGLRARLRVARRIPRPRWVRPPRPGRLQVVVEARPRCPWGGGGFTGRRGFVVASR